MKIKSYFVFVVIIFFATEIVSSKTIETKKDSTKKEFPGKVFGNIYTGFYYGSSKLVPQTKFELSTALLGYTHAISENVKAILIYDVFKTTNFEFTDSSGISKYFEGSNYSGFLKMAQIDWKINNLLEINVGQMLNEQYLTVQDKFWGYRYIAFTFQEMNRFGKQADFGARLKFHLLNDKLHYSITAVNGEGPFYYQDDDAKFLFANNIEYRPNDALIIKAYGDYQPAAVDSLNPRIVFSGFIGYKKEKFRIAGEYSSVFNQSYIDGSNYSGLSFYGTYSINKKFEFLGRIDYIHEAANISEGQYYIAGFQYTPVKNFFTSLNFRHNQHFDFSQIYANFGIKF